MKRPVVKTCRRDSYAKLAPLNRNLSTILRFKGVKRAWIQSSGWLWCDERKTEGASGNATSSRCLYPHRLPFCVSGTWPTVLVHRCPSNLSRSLFLSAFTLSLPFLLLIWSKMQSRLVDQPVTRIMIKRRWP